MNQQVAALTVAPFLCHSAFQINKEVLHTQGAGQVPRGWEGADCSGLGQSAVSGGVGEKTAADTARRLEDTWSYVEGVDARNSGPRGESLSAGSGVRRDQTAAAHATGGAAAGRAWLSPAWSPVGAACLPT